MKNLFLSFFFVVFLLEGQAQIAVNNDGSNPDSSAILDLQSSNKGFLIPRLTEAQIKAIHNPANGLMVFNKDKGRLFIFLVSEYKWKELQVGNSEIVYPASLSIGSGNSCSNSTVNGSYKTNQSLNASNTVVIEANVSSKGRWEIVTDTVNGYSFYGNGVVSSTGTVSLTLTGSGTPSSKQTDQFTASVTIGGNSTCTFNVEVLCYMDCNDNNLCTIDSLDTENCVCINTPKNCNDNNLCTEDSCDPNTGDCINTPKNCDDGNPCTVDSCDTNTGDCINTPKNCDDGNPCTVDTCDPNTGTCNHAPKDCDDGDPNTNDSCDPNTGECVHTSKK